MPNSHMKIMLTYRTNRKHCEISLSFYRNCKIIDNPGIVAQYCS